MLDRAKLAPASGVHRGAYVLQDADGGAPDVILIGTGSEVQLALGARELLADTGARVRVVSAPCIELFLEQDAAYRNSVLPARRLAPGVGRGGCGVRLVSTGRRSRTLHLGRALRRVGARTGDLRAPRHHVGGRGGSRARAAGGGLSHALV